MKLRLDYGTTGLFADFPDDRTTVIEPAYVPPAADHARRWLPPFEARSADGH